MAGALSVTHVRPSKRRPLSKSNTFNSLVYEIQIGPK